MITPNNSATTNNVADIQKSKATDIAKTIISLTIKNNPDATKDEVELIRKYLLRNSCFENLLRCFKSPVFIFLI